MDLAGLLKRRAGWRRAGDVVVFTNGCFDLLHRGHVDFLARAKALGSVLVVGLNGDASVRAIKGPGRPVAGQADRATVVGALASVDAVTIFDEPTPARLIAALEPDVLVKGGDWPVEQIVGADEVVRRGGRVLSLPLVPGHSSSVLIERVLAAHRATVEVPTEAQADPRLGPLAESIRVKQRLLAECGDAILKSGQILTNALLGGGKALFFGNGGSAAEAQHLAAELVGRFQRERRALPALALTTDTSALTSLGNDLLLFERDGRPSAISPLARAVYDVTGAGDTVIAAVSLALAAGLHLEQAVRLANVAAGLAVEQVGTTAVTAAHLREALSGVRALPEAPVAPTG